MKKLNISARIQTDTVGCYEITWETGEPEFICVHVPRCYEGATKPVDILTIRNICDGGGPGDNGDDSGGSTGNTGDIGSTGGTDSNGGALGGGSYNTFPYNGVPTDQDLKNVLSQISGFSTISYEMKDFIVDNYLVNYNLDIALFSTNFILQNPNTTIEQFQKWFLDGYSAQSHKIIFSSIISFCKY